MMNKIIFGSVLLIAMGWTTVRTELSDENLQDCLNKFIHRVREIKVPEKIKQFAEFVRDQDPSGSEGLFDIMIRPEFDINKFAGSPAELDNLKLVADPFYKNLKQIQHDLPSSCFEGDRFDERLHQIETDSSNEDSAKIVAFWNYKDICVRIIHAGDELRPSSDEDEDDDDE